MAEEDSGSDIPQCESPHQELTNEKQKAMVGVIILPFNYRTTSISFHSEMEYCFYFIKYVRSIKYE